MLEIILLIFLARKIKAKVEPKGYKAGKWQAYLVLSWIGAEIFGMLISLLLFRSDTMIALISGYLCAGGVALFVFNRADALPDINEKNNDWLDNLGND
ncbi:hypothetical protein F0919_14420 [Taibaiella lutea]|uniref:Uncharacterized protein n=1 Tax=Taibaiella lutea TaxID=2608001 RepID=A0A5M6CFJ3_9BACT|nr:hypothetical protein [Taibaiella lutea]KAA5533723.1 hypothetical protein F0919_14420 [Taibaiella lutea]